jgi:lipopolysaccharide export system protein LptA
MAINAVITQPRLIIANTSQITSTQSNAPISLKNNVASVSQNYLHNLLDVDASNPVDGDTLIYNANTGKYDVAPISIGSAVLDGGSF